MSCNERNTEGILSLTGQLVAVKISGNPPVVEIGCQDEVRVNDPVTLYEGRHQTEGIRVSNTEGISSSANTSTSGAMDQHVTLNKGRPPQNEEGADEVCRTLIERLNQDGYSIDPATLQKQVKEDDDTDFTAKTGRQVLQFQVTRCAPTASFWANLARFQEQDQQWSNPEPLIDAIRKAIERKAQQITPGAQRNKIILAIDAVHSPVLTLSETITAFRRAHAAWASCLGFDAIWVIGPAPSVTHRVCKSE